METIDTTLLSETDGITATSAQHLCNIGKEFCKSADAALENIQFYTESVKLMTESEPVVLSIGVDNTTLTTIHEALACKAKIYAFIAWMREAIKAKNTAIELVKSCTINDWASKYGIEIPEPWKAKEPVDQSIFINQLTVKERNRYFQLEAEAAVLGNAIHPNGGIHAARKALYDAKTKPNKISGDKVFTKVETITAEEVDKFYFELQRKHREVEAALNAIKGALDQKVTEYNIAVSKENQEAVTRYNEQYRLVSAQYQVWKENELKRLHKLKIVIPDDQKEIYDFLSKL